MLEGVAAAARYPDGGANEADDGSTGRGLGGDRGNAGRGGVPTEAEQLAAREEQWEVEERRRELLVLLRNAAKLTFPEALSFVTARLQSALSSGGGSGSSGCGGSGGGGGGGGGGAAAAAAGGGGSGGGGPGSAAAGAAAGCGGGSCAFQDSELAVSLLYELGEGAPEDELKPGGGLGQLVLLLLARCDDLRAGSHRLVALALLETVVRYLRLLQAEPGALPVAMRLFLGPRGLGHPAPDVATRACYLLSRLIKVLRSSLRPHAAEVLAQLQPYLQIVATAPPLMLALGGAAGTAGGGRDGGGGGGGGGAGGGGGPRAMLTAVIDDRLYVFESAGLLLGQEELQPEQQAAALTSLLAPLTQQVEANLAAAAAAEAGGAGMPPGGPAWAVLQAMEAITRLNKGFKFELAMRSRPQLGAALKAFQILLGFGLLLLFVRFACMLSSQWQQ